QDDAAELADSAGQRSKPTDAVAAGMRGAFDVPPTAELIEGVRKLPPATDVPALAADDVTKPDPRFRLGRMLRPVRRVLAGVIVLVGLDAAATIALPALYQFGVDHGVRPGVASVVWITAGVGAVIVAIDWLVIRKQTRTTARAGETVLYSLRVRSYAHL